MEARDESGNTYSALLVLCRYDDSVAAILRRQRIQGGHRTGPAAHWLCQCDCGRLCVVPGKRLRAKRQVSCGHFRASIYVRRQARMHMSAKQRKQIARSGGIASSKVGTPMGERRWKKMKKQWGGKRAGAGRPRSDKPRCKCGTTTAKRALARGCRGCEAAVDSGSHKRIDLKGL